MIMQSRGPKHTARAERPSLSQEGGSGLRHGDGTHVVLQRTEALRAQKTANAKGAAHLPVTAKDSEFLIINNKCSFHSVLLIGTYRIYTSKVEKQVCTKGN